MHARFVSTAKRLVFPDDALFPNVCPRNGKTLSGFLIFKQGLLLMRPDNGSPKYPLRYCPSSVESITNERATNDERSRRVYGR